MLYILNRKQNYKKKVTNNMFRHQFFVFFHKCQKYARNRIGGGSEKPK